MENLSKTIMKKKNKVKKSSTKKKFKSIIQKDTTEKDGAP